MRIEGIKKLKKEDLVKNTKAMLMIMNPEKAKEMGIKVRKPRAKELLPRKEYDRAEDRLRPVIINELRRLGCKVMRLENSITGKNNIGFPDLWIFNPRNNWGGWIEVKTPFGIMLDEQLDFQSMCKLCKVNHIEFRKWSDLEVIFEKR